MKMLDHLLHQLKLRGLEVKYRDEQTLTIAGPEKEKTPEIMAALKAFKPDLLIRLRPRNMELPRHDVHHPPPPPDKHQCQIVCTTCNGFVWDTEEYAVMCDVMTCPWKNIK